MSHHSCRICLALLILPVVLTGCGSEDEPIVFSTSPGAEPQHFTASAGESRILALGDSYVIGQSVTHPERWPNVLAAELRSKGIEPGQPLIMAVTGYTTGDLLELLETRPPRDTFDLVLLQIGAHNQDQGLPTGRFRLELAKLIQMATDYAGGDPQRVVVLSIPDWSVTPWARRNERARIREEIDRFNAALQSEARKAGVHWVNVTAQSRLAARNPELISDDDLHPSGEMYKLWVKELLPLATRIMTGSDSPPANAPGAAAGATTAGMVPASSAP